MSEDYKNLDEDLRAGIKALGKEIPVPMTGFFQLHKAVLSDGALSVKTKELIALAISVCLRCEGCIALHMHDVLKAGATREEVADAIGVAVVMGGGPSVVYGSKALEALEQFSGP